ncbi:MAG: RimJ/RimL family protein N-acetyltransferase [Myxococcota bacterium]
MIPELRTKRLVLRDWRNEDLAPFAALNADPEVMEHFPSRLNRAESDAMVARIRGHFKVHGVGLWATEETASGEFMGFVGLAIPDFEAPFTPCIEVGWRLAKPYWGKGYATEAAAAAMRFGFESYGRDEIVSFTVPANLRSRRVMEKLGLKRNSADDFDHPSLGEADPLRRHVLYRVSRSAWSAPAPR